MGTTAQKLEYLGTTKSQLKDMINYGLDENKITSSTTFRNYVSSIFNAFLEALRTPDTLFTNLPKKSGTGANITLNDTANAPMRIQLGATELSQDGTPTPSSPQAVHTISGSNKVVVNGKNLIPYQDKDFTINGVNFKTINGNLILNGTATFNITGDMLVNDNYLKVDVEHTTYYLTRTNVNSNLTINLMGENSTLVAQLPRNSSDLSTTVSISSSNKVYLGFFIPQGATFNNYDGGIMVSKAGGTYEPYISQEADIDLDTIEYCKIGNYEDKFIRTSGKNKLDTSKFVSSTYIPSIDNNSSVIDILTNENYGLKNLFDNLNLKAGNYSIYCEVLSGTYTGGNLLFYDLNGTKNDTEYNFRTQGLVKNFNATNGLGSIKMWNPYATSNVKLKIWVVEGTYTSSTIPDYEPYGSNEWYIKKNIGKTIIDSSNVDDLITNFGQTNNKNRINIDKSKLGWQTSWTTGICLMNKYKEITSTSAVASGTFAFNFGQTIIIIWNDAFTDLATAKTELLGTEIYIAQATPTYTQITGTLKTQLENIYQKLLSYSGTTNISQVNNDLSFNMVVSAIEK